MAGRLSLSEISRRSGLSLTTTHRLVGELTAWQALERREDGRCAVGRRIGALGLLAPLSHELRCVPCRSRRTGTTRPGGTSTWLC